MTNPLDNLAANYRDIINGLGEDTSREGLQDTPMRAAKAMQFLCRGYTQSLEEIVNGALFDSDNDEMVIVKDIELYSLCEHHMLPFFGKAHVGYIPNGKVIGLSKIPRLIDMYARRLQVQERLTHQVANSIKYALNPKGVAVVMEGRHMCMQMRGVEKQNSFTSTSAMFGQFKKSAETRSEFLDIISRGKI